MLHHYFWRKTPTHHHHPTYPTSPHPANPLPYPVLICNTAEYPIRHSLFESFVNLNIGHIQVEPSFWPEYQKKRKRESWPLVSHFFQRRPESCVIKIAQVSHRANKEHLTVQNGKSLPTWNGKCHDPRIERRSRDKSARVLGTKKKSRPKKTRMEAVNQEGIRVVDRNLTNVKFCNGGRIDRAEKIDKSTKKRTTERQESNEWLTSWEWQVHGHCQNENAEMATGEVKWSRSVVIWRGKGSKDRRSDF